MNYIDGEYSEFYLKMGEQEDVKPSLFAVSRIFAECRKQMTVSEFKTLVFALSNIDWTSDCPDTLYCDKKQLAKVIGITSDINHLSVDVNRSIGELPRHSFLKFRDKENGIYDNGNFVRRVTMLKNTVRIKLEKDYLQLFGNLDKNYITMWSGDIFNMTSERSILLYELLRNNSDTRLNINSGTISVAKFKEMYNIPKDGAGSYMTKEGHFARTHFEKYVINPACSELIKTEMVRLILQENGGYYEKIKRGNRVIAYKFYWEITEPKTKIDKNNKNNVEDERIKELWETALEKFDFSPEEIAAIGSRLRLIPQTIMIDNNANPGNIEINRFHFMEKIAKDIIVERKKKNIKNEYKYLIKMLDNICKNS